ncbi:hypothetical protein L1987_75108 [Smallanthus sonchifolius]|uniref:Uncharacterized protein n=1 Tax=Smallanthus sonchifolius TaxID=185202 RepID=A0ACB9A3T2_9ASTR|nr:hypothetical protein L1987_75108 [Smallanthus sonchifolius]
MVKLTIVGRIHDGLPISQGTISEEDDDSITYKKHAEFLLHEISMDTLPSSNTTVFLHHHRFNYMVRNGVCFITLCDASYPRKLAFHYLQDLQKEFDKVDPELVNQITQPYSFVKFDILERMMKAHKSTSPVWNSKTLEVEPTSPTCSINVN